MTKFIQFNLYLIFTLSADGDPVFLVTKSETLISGAYWACPMWYVLAKMFDAFTTGEWSSFTTTKYKKLPDERKDEIDDMFSRQLEEFLADIAENGFTV